ncbi:T120A protein, partial [Polypterus senegalus]
MSVVPSVNDCFQEWDGLQKEFQQIQETHRLYKKNLSEVTKLQEQCLATITRQKKKLKELSTALKSCTSSANADEIETIKKIQDFIKGQTSAFFEMEAFLPKKNGFAYKDEYEKFKLCLTVILLVVSFTCRFLVSYRVIDAVFNFLLVWYYCTLTIRESILINNGSRPDGPLYQMFRNQFLSYSLYQSFVQFLQYYYQSGCLYRLRALGERHTMDLTVGEWKRLGQY